MEWRKREKREKESPRAYHYNRSKIVRQRQEKGKVQISTYATTFSIASFERISAILEPRAWQASLPLGRVSLAPLSQ